jgi:hypothetical protein
MCQRDGDRQVAVCDASRSTPQCPAAEDGVGGRQQRDRDPTAPTFAS